MLKHNLFTRFECFIDKPWFEEPKFEVISAEITEQLSSAYEIKVKLTSPIINLVPRHFIKHPARLLLNFGRKRRYFHGLIGEFSQLQMIYDQEGNPLMVYEVCLYPHFWFMQFNQDYRIFQNKTTLQIVSDVLHENQMQHVQFPQLYHEGMLRDVDTEREYCVQYGESDFNFISRLLEDKGFYYYYEHRLTQHVLRVAYNHHDHTFCPVIPAVQIRDSDFKGNEINKIKTYKIGSKTLPQHHISMDYNYEYSSLELYSQGSSIGDSGIVYQYPAGVQYSKEAEVSVRHKEEEDIGKDVTLSGTSVAPYFSPGFKFALLGCPNSRYDEQVFTLNSVTHKIIDPRYAGEDDLVYENTFSAFLSSHPYRPEKKTPKPKIHGTQTAMVVAPHGEEVWTDAQGRVKLQFHWNHRGYRPPLIIHPRHGMPGRRPQHAPEMGRGGFEEGYRSEGERQYHREHMMREESYHHREVSEYEGAPRRFEPSRSKYETYEE